MAVVEIAALRPIAQPSISEPSFANAIELIAESDDLDADKNRHWPTSLRQIAAYLGRPLETIPARIAAINGAVKKLHPEWLGVHAKTFSNHRSNVRAALLWFNRQTLGTGRNAPMAGPYRRLLERVDDRHVKDRLSPFFRYLSGFGVEPAGVDNAHVEKFLAWRTETGFGKVTAGQHRGLARDWNACADRIAEWPHRRLVEPALAKRFTGPAFEDFPEGLRADIDAYCGRIGKRQRNASGRPLRPCAPSTIAMRRRELIAAIRAAVEASIPLGDLQTLGDLLRPDRAEIVIEHYWRRNGETPSRYTIDLAWRLLTLARSESGFGAAELERLNDIRLTLEEHRTSGLTEKNRTLVRQVIQSDVWRKVIELPERLMAEARSDTTRSPIRSAVTAELAIAIRILVIAPIRMQNLASIRLDDNLVRPSGPGTPYLLTFPDYDVKNRVPLEFPFDSGTTAMIDEYVHRHRPQLMRGRNHDCLFPGSTRDQKAAQDLAEHISRRLWKVLGLKITPHQFRHAAAAIILRQEPGNYELVRRVLGHRNIQTTTNFYVGLESLEATRRFGEMVTAMTRPPSTLLRKRSYKESERRRG